MTDHIVDANKKVSPCPVCGTGPIVDVLMHSTTVNNATVSTGEVEK